ncbi:hypothetical protein K432DRAFT_383971 [Lepidopterella palustris CBS 459.81]|uniref:Uncharacterized protein n=1 Tax=Lepidopterella palustris CBS 459.81 TaxID=1314670 RepID=A0A8E2JDE4_9PEZI|nr:hypothetical protein K432DRAFT_383971 [Lepidopterella palustris CBS 459.81]
MADKPTPHLIDSSTPETYPQPPLSPAPPTNPHSHSTRVFTPRSSTFPDGDSDSEFDFLEPTPVHSPGGPHYDDLPPSYEQAQAQTLSQARANYQSLSINDLQVYRLSLDPDASLPPQFSPYQIQTQAQPANSQTLRNSEGLGSTIPVTAIPNSTAIPVHQIPSSRVDANTILLNRALEFTQHVPDADARYAPRLLRKIAIPQDLGLTATTPGPNSNSNPNSSTTSLNSSHSAPGGTERGFGRGGGHRGWGEHRHHGRHGHRMPGEWPNNNTATSALEVPTPISPQPPVQFLRAYAKALHTHSIRPAEFAAFLDGLNILLSATNTSSSALISQPSPAQLVQDYLVESNTQFFAPRGLRVYVKSQGSLVSSLGIPTERGQQAAAVATLEDQATSAAGRAMALYPWIERLEVEEVPAPGAGTVALQEMAERLCQTKSQTQPQPQMQSPRPSCGDTEEKQDIGPDPTAGARLHRSVTTPSTFPPPPTSPSGRPWPQVPGAWPPRGPSHGAWGPRGRGGWGSRGSWGRGGCGGHGGIPFIPSIPPIPPFNPQSKSRPGWAQWGENWGKWGEELGKRAERWGEEFGRRVEVWGEGVGRNAEAWGEGIERRVSAGGRGTGQETGVTGTHQSQQWDAKEEGSPDNNDDDDSDTSSISSFSSSSSSSDDDDDDFEDPQERFIEKVRSINTKAALAQSKGKKSSEEISRERDAAIAKASAEKTALELKIEQKRNKRAVKRELKIQKRAMKKEVRRQKRALKAAARQSGNGTVDEVERRRVREEWRKKKRALKEEKRARRREWREARRERKGMGRYGKRGVVGEVQREGGTEREREALWLVVENID